MFCVECGEEILDQAHFCPACGADQNYGKKRSPEHIKKVIKEAAVVAAPVVGATVSNMGKQALRKPTEKVRKQTEKKIGKIAKGVTHEVLVALKLEKRSPVEKIQRIIKKR